MTRRRSPATDLARLPRRVLAHLDESVYLGIFSSPRPAAWRFAHRVLSAPPLLWGRQRRYTASAGACTVRIASCGPPKRLDPTLDAAFGRLGTATEHGRVPLWSPRRLSRLPADLVAVAVHRWLAQHFRRSGWLTVPQAVRWQADVRAFPPSTRHSLASDVKRAERRGYTPEITTSPSAWQEFASRMLLPLALGRFGARAAVPSLRQLRAFAARGYLIFVCQDGERLGGLCAVPRGDTLWLPLMGVRDADPRLAREPTSAALHVQAFEWARAHGFERLDFGRTSPFTTDGLHRYRRKWGLEPCRDPLTPLTALRLDASCEALARTFQRRSVLVDTGRGLRRFPAAG